MFTTNYYCLVAGLKEYSLDADTKGFDAKAIVGEILEGWTGPMPTRCGCCTAITTVRISLRCVRGARRTIRWVTSHARSWKRR